MNTHQGCRHSQWVALESLVSECATYWVAEADIQYQINTPQENIFGVSVSIYTSYVTVAQPRLHFQPSSIAIEDNVCARRSSNINTESFSCVSPMVRLIKSSTPLSLQIVWTDFDPHSMSSSPMLDVWFHTSSYLW